MCRAFVDHSKERLAALLEFFRGMRGAVHVVFEEGTQAQWLYDLLVPRVAQVLVCDRRGQPQRGSKGEGQEGGRDGLSRPGGGRAAESRSSL
jgi:hypothetical protein